MNERDTPGMGLVQVHHKVLEEIVYTSMRGIDGIRLGKRGGWAALGNWISGVKYPGIHVRVRPNNEAHVEVRVFVRYGLNIPQLARRVQDSVKSALERTTEVNVKEVNVNIRGVDREV
jgi:uncharacterized alkaline shock family protein YloU